MYLSALTIGHVVLDTDFVATIHSVFHSVVNLRLDGNDLLLTLITADGPDLPQGVRVDTPPEFSFVTTHVGEKVIFQGKRFFFENTSLTIDLHKVHRWKCHLPAVDLTRPLVAAAWDCVWQVLNERQVRENAEIVAGYLFRADGDRRSLIARKMGEAVRNLEVNWQLSIQQLIGLGGGLTPCGDDFLVGYLAGLWCIACSLERQQFVDDFGDKVIQCAGKTNDISRTYLYHAAHGHVSSRLAALAKAIGEGKTSQELISAVDLAMQSGHTSGMDTVTGLLFGLVAWGTTQNFSFKNHAVIEK